MELYILWSLFASLGSCSTLFFTLYSNHRDLISHTITFFPLWAFIYYYLAHYSTPDALEYILHIIQVSA